MSATAPHQPGTDRRARRRRRAFRATAVILGTAAALLLAEGALQVLCPPPPDGRVLCLMPGDARRLVMRPDVRLDLCGAPFETNRQGFRARRDFHTDKPDGVRRIAVIGDSFTVSPGVPFEQIFTTRLEQMLGNDSSGRPAEVLNFAVPGHNLVQHLATLSDIALAYHPDLILLCLLPINDFQTAEYDAHGARLAPSRPGDPPLEIDPPSRSLYRLPYLRRLLSLRLAPLARRFGLARLSPRLSTYQERLLAEFREQGRDWRRSTDALHELARRARAAGVPVIAVPMPANSDHNDVLREVYAISAAEVSRAGIPQVSLQPAFAATGRPTRAFQLSPIDTHPNGAYNAVVAEAIFAFLEGGGGRDPVPITGTEEQ